MTTLGAIGTLEAIKGQFAALIIAALSFTVALAWNSAVQSYFREQLKTDTSSLRGQLIYAVLVTLFTLAVVYVMVQYFKIDAKARLF